jgi:hypothetical protein
MKVLHITPSSGGYEEVELIANRVSQTNGLAVIKKDGELYYTGGIIFEDLEKIRKVFDALPKEEQYELALAFKTTPFVKMFFEPIQ